MIGSPQARAFYLVLITLVALTGCEAPSPSAATQPNGAATTKPTLRVAIMLPGNPTDGGWLEDGWKATQALETQMQAKVQRTVATTDQPFEDDLRELARTNDLVIAHGGEYAKTLLDVAEEFTGTSFINSGGELIGPQNFKAVSFRLEQATYLAGIVAGHVTQTKKIGAIGGQDFASVQRTMDAFIAGAKSVDPSIQAIKVYANTWNDPAKAKEVAEALLAQGVDVVFQNTNAASAGIFEACAARNAYAFGCNGDQNDHPRFSGIILGSSVIDMKKAFYDLAQAVQGQAFPGGDPLMADLAAGYVRYVPNPRTMDKVPPGAASAVDAAQQKIIAGELRVLAE